ncbi:MAG: hypothetical protein ACOCQ1_00855 [Halanaerobiaceae bacterium]
MFLLQTDFRYKLIILTICIILLGTVLVAFGAYLTDNYFSNMVSGLVGDYGEYDLLFTLSQDKQEMALEQIESIISSSLSGSSLKEGPRVAGSSNYLLKLPQKYRNEDVYSNLENYFSDIPGLMSKTIISEPRLSLRGFRGNSQSVIREVLEEIEGVDFLYESSDGFDVIVNKPELVPDVKDEINEILKEYRLFEVRYPLDQHPDNVEEVRQKVKEQVESEFSQLKIMDISENVNSDRVSLLESLKQMRAFLLSYAARIEIEDLENSKDYPVGGKLVASHQKEDLVLNIVENDNQRLVALGENEGLKTENSFEIYKRELDGSRGQYLGTGKVHNPRHDLGEALEKLDEISPALEGFMDRSEELVAYSQKLNQDLSEVKQNLTNLGTTGEKLNKSLEKWQKEELSFFLQELTGILENMEDNFGDTNQVQKELIITSNRLRSGARLIEEKMVYIPRNNELYSELDQIKDLFMEVSSALDENYDLVSNRLEEMGPIMGSVDEWQEKIDSLLTVEETLSQSTNWQEVDDIIADINQTLEVSDIKYLKESLESIQKLLMEINDSQLPVILEQLQHIQTALPDMEEREIIETINLIDDYIAGEVIPGEQIQIMVQGEYSEKELQKQAEKVVKNPAVNYLDMDIGLLQPNPRGEVFNILRQVRSVISILLAFVFTLLVLMLDQSLLISVINLNQGRGYLYGFFNGGFILTAIYFLSQIDFPYLKLTGVFLIGGLMGLATCLFSEMLNPVSEEEWEAGKALGLTPGEIMSEIIIPSGKPGLLYLLNYPRIIFK